MKKNTILLSLILASSLALQACGPTTDNKANTATDEEITTDVTIDTTAPFIRQLYPKMNMGVQARKTFVRGVIEDDAIKSVVISNGEVSVIADVDGNVFSALIDSVPGENTYTVVATDEAGNETIVSESYYFGARVSAGGSHSGAIVNDRIYAWGRNNKGQSGSGFITSINDSADDATGPHPTSPVLVKMDTVAGNETKFVSLSFGQNASSALDADGKVWSWGDGDEGQLGLGIAGDGVIDETDQTTPQKIEGISDIVAISRGIDNLLMLKADGTVFAVGSNDEGQLGDGSGEDQDSPVMVNGLSNIVQISASISSYAVDQDGRLWAWGSNNYGQLANGVEDGNVHSIPVQISIDEPVVSVATGKGHVLALTTSGSVYAWGLNASSQVGLHESGTWEGDIYTPTLLPWFDDAVAVWAKGNQSFVQRSDGKVYPWGQNMLGTLGVEQDGNVEEPNSPIFGLENVLDLGNGALHTLALREDGELFSWGWSFEGSLGGGDSTINAWSYRLPLVLSVPESL